jgi:hypothetical protein
MMLLVTLVWKEFCEHRAIWFTMVLVTCVMGPGLAHIVAPGDQVTALAVASLSILGLAGAYGVVCGAMMLAGEHENGTLVFLDIFLGQRHVLWFAKFLIGIVLAATEAVIVSLVLFLMKQAPPPWLPELVGIDVLNGPVPVAHLDAGPLLWLAVVPLVTVEAFAWGMLGSALTRRVLSAAAAAALIAAPIWLVAVCLPAPVFVAIRLLAAFVAVLISYSVFFSQARESSPALAPLPTKQPYDARRRFMELWAEYERQDRAERGEPIDGETEPVEVLSLLEPEARVEPEPIVAQEPRARRRRKLSAAGSAAEALGWLTLQQARDLCLAIAGVAIVVGLFLPIHGGVLWPVATMLLGVACGVAAFGPEQRDLSYQFLASQHLPLGSIWRFKITFWFLAAVLGSLILVFSGMVVVFGRFMLAARDQGGQVPVDFQLGTLREVLGPILFYSVWLVYGFASGQVLVWLCRKTILAVLLSLLTGGIALGLWMPSLICRGMSGWQVWVPPLVMLGAAHYLVRAWAGGRIKERRPLAVLIGCALVGLVWVGVNLGYRAIEIPDVGPPLDVAEFRESIPAGEDNRAGQKIQDAATLFGQRDGANPQWLEHIAEMAKLPTGSAEPPRGDGGSPLLRHLPACEGMSQQLLQRARNTEPGPAIGYLVQVLALSRNLRNKSPAASYLVGVQIERQALEDGVKPLLARGRPTTANLESLLKELNRHAADTAPPLDCANSECFRAGGLLTMPGQWTFASGSRERPGRIPERWLAGGIAVSLELPWEDERKVRLWQLVWKGLLRGVKAPHWELRTALSESGVGSDATRKILEGWLSEAGSPTRADVARLLDASWLTDPSLFCPTVPLHHAGTRSQWRVDAMRLSVALALYEQSERKPAEKLDDLVPKYLPKLPIDPYSGQPFHYRVSAGERIEGVGVVQPGQGVLWSTGPDGIDHGANHGGDWLPDADPEWGRGRFDLVTLAPHWP